MNRPLRHLAASLGWALLALHELYHLGTVPGLHFDEAWAYNFAWRIAHEPGFWPLTAMSPYTSPWTHYWAALWLRLLGPSLAVFRGSQIALSLAGLAALSRALPRHARALFPWACLILPGLILNHRFSVELTGFHVLCFGLFCWGIRERWYGLSAVAALFGTTAHILFYAVPLSLLAVVCLEGVVLPRRARLAAMAYFALLALFFLRVLAEIPEKGKAGALLLSALAALTLLAIHGERWIVWRAGVWRALVALGSVVFLGNAIFFAQGIWTGSIYSGFDVWAAPAFGPPVAILLSGLALAATCLLALLHARRDLRTWFLAGAFLVGIMMLKPAPRYFELLFLALAALVAVQVSSYLAAHANERASVLRSAALAVLLLLLFHNLKAAVGLPLTAEISGAKDTELHFLFFKDSSRDFLDKQDLARFLGGSGCRRGDIQTHDPRLKEELDALALGDWKVTSGTRCLYSAVARRSEEGARGEQYGEFLVTAVKE